MRDFNNVENKIHKIHQNALCIDSDLFVGMHYILLGKEVILYHNVCGKFNFNAKNWKELRNEIDEILQLHLNIGEE